VERNMHKLDERLAEWMEAYRRLKEARARLKAAAATPLGAPEELRDEAHRVQIEADAALHALQLEFEALKKRR
jgi:hypothetical protein